MIGKMVCVVGYGGRVDIGHALLELGAERVILQDPFAPICRFGDPDYKGRENSPWFKIILTNLYGVKVSSLTSSYQTRFLSTPRTQRAFAGCAGATRNGESNIHYIDIDLGNHFFKYPFEMLCYLESTWRRSLNASNLNRLRIPDYQRSFERVFKTVDFEITEWLLSEFQRTEPRSESLTGDERIEAASFVRIEAT